MKSYTQSLVSQLGFHNFRHIYSKDLQNSRTRPNVKHLTATFISYLISVIILPTLEEKLHLL